MQERQLVGHWDAQQSPRFLSKKSGLRGMGVLFAAHPDHAGERIAANDDMK
jgi:hypothetical protein